MLVTNLIGRQFTGNMSKTVYTVVAVYLESGRLWILGESDLGRLVSFSFGEITLKPGVPHVADENLLGVV